MMTGAEVALLFFVFGAGVSSLLVAFWAWNVPKTPPPKLPPERVEADQLTIFDQKD